MYLRRTIRLGAERSSGCSMFRHVCSAVYFLTIPNHNYSSWLTSWHTHIRSTFILWIFKFEEVLLDSSGLSYKTKHVCRLCDDRESSEQLLKRKKEKARKERRKDDELERQRAVDRTGGGNQMGVQ